MERLTYANVMATLAVFIALGGSAFAATQLKKNSVGTKQLKKNSVTSPKVKNGSLRAGDFRPGTLLAGPTGTSGTQGAQGLTGPTGVTGVDGESATRLFAKVLGSGVLQAGSPGANVTKLPGLGDYEVSWGSQDLSNCAAAATVDSGAFGQGLVRRSISPTANNKVRIIAQNTAAALIDQAFDVAVFC